MTHAANDRSLSTLQKTAKPFSQSISSTADFQRNQQQIAQLLAQLNQIVLDKPQAVRLALSCILAGGHLLLQDLPGMGKTTLAQGLAQLVGDGADGAADNALVTLAKMLLRRVRWRRRHCS